MNTLALDVSQMTMITCLSVYGEPTPKLFGLHGFVIMQLEDSVTNIYTMADGNHSMLHLENAARSAPTTALGSQLLVPP